MAKETLSALADAVADHRAVDWLEAESSATDPDERDRIRQLRMLATLSEAARALAPRWGPFELRGEIGRGAFGTVHRAWDERLGRDVALKLLHDDTVDRGGVIAEARLLAGVEHPNIVPIYGADVHDGRVGLWMKLVHGKTLKEILVEQGPFGAEEAAQIGRALCRALAAVHKRGFVHRDVKAQNVMRGVGGDILLMDFGAGDAAIGAQGGATRGSPAYLAPEVLAGGVATPQSDIYSVGVLLFHLASGRFPVAAASWEDLQAVHRERGPSSVRDERPDAPQWFVDAVDRALAPDVGQRLATAGQLETLLRPPQPAKPATSAPWLIVSATLVIAALGAVVYRDLPRNAGVQPLSLAPWPATYRVGVLPLRNLTGDDSKDVAAAGLTELLITHLARLPGLSIPSSASAASLGDAAPTVAVAQALGVDLLLAGAMTEAGGRLHVSVRLVDPVADRTLWGEEVVRVNDSVFSAAEHIAQAVAGRLSITRSGMRSQFAPRAPEVEDAYLRGLADLNSSLDRRLPSAVSHLSRAVELDPTFAEGWAQLALADQRYTELRNPAEREALAAVVREKALRALSLDATLPTAHAALGVMQFHHDWDFAAAEASFRRAIDLVPSDASSRAQLAWLLAAEARHDEAIAQAEAARSLEPLVASAYTTLGMIRYYAHDYPRALGDLQHALELSPGYPLAQLCIGRVLIATGDSAGAIEAVEDAVRSGRNPGWLWVLAQAQSMAGREAEMQRTLDEIDRNAAEGRFASVDNRGYLLVSQGRVDEALPYFEEAIKRRMTNVLWLAVDPRVDAIRDEPRFSALLARMRR